MEQTEKYKLNKPGDNDYGEVAALNENMDKIETALAAEETARTDHEAGKDNPHGVTAEQVGARPSSWMPTAAQVGALPVQSGKPGQLLGFTADNTIGAVNAPTAGVTSFKGRIGAVQPASGDYTAAQVGAWPSSWMPTAANVGALPITGGTITGNLTLKGTQNYGTKLNFGDGDYVHLYEIEDDTLEIKGSRIKLVAANDASITLNGKKLLIENPSLSQTTANLIMISNNVNIILNNSLYYTDGRLIALEIHCRLQPLSDHTSLAFYINNPPNSIINHTLLGQLYVTLNSSNNSGGTPMELQVNSIELQPNSSHAATISLEATKFGANKYFNIDASVVYMAKNV